MDFLPVVITAAVMTAARWPGHLLWSWLRQKHGIP